MVAKKTETAEQKLLKMIEATSGPAAGAPGKKEQAVANKQTLLSFLRLANKLLILLIVAAFIFVGYEMKSGLSSLRQTVQASTQPGTVRAASGAEILLPSLQGVSFYLANITSRNIFKPYEKKKSVKIDSSSGENQRIRKMTDGYRLVGVSWLDHIDTASVMIEDTEKQVTYFKRKGEKIGNIIVKTIYAESALLGYEDEEMMITYDKSQM